MSASEARHQRCGTNAAGRFDGQARTLPIAHAFALASGAGISTIEINVGNLTASLTKLNRTEVVTSIEKLINADAIWTRLNSRPTQCTTALAPFALFHLHDGILPDANLTVPISSGPGTPLTVALCDSLTETCLDRLSVLRDIQPDAVLDVAIRPSLEVVARFRTIS
jgi:hypothetical protein